jgi:hypothetical protein
MGIMKSRIASGSFAGQIIAVAFESSPAPPDSPEGSTLRYTFAGELTATKDLAFSIFEGGETFLFPSARQVPTAFEGVLTIDKGSSEATLSLKGEFASPAQSLSWAVELTEIAGGIVCADAEGVEIADFFEAFGLQLSLSVKDRTGVLSFWKPSLEAKPSGSRRKGVIGASSMRIEADGYFDMGVYETAERSRAGWA